MENKYLFTVFTPTFNREKTLHRVYESLKSQTFQDFEWLIVDDGSNDSTRELVNKWIQESNFPIRYIYQENQGKHCAFNKGVQEAKGELFLTLDSDDGCVAHALERFAYHWEGIPDDQKSQFSAVTSLCVDQYGNTIGDRFPLDVFDSNSLESYYKCKIRGEKWGFHKTDVLKQFPFPVRSDCKFIPEGIVWSAIARKYKTRYINEYLRVYWKEDRGQSNQLSNIQNPSRHAAGHVLWYQSKLENEIDWFRYSPAQFVRCAIHFSRFSFHIKEGVIKQNQSLTNFWSKFLWFSMLPIGYLVYKKDIILYKKN
jgi:glycosyltransferase involved in cell wall biosynthesis